MITTDDRFAEVFRLVRLALSYAEVDPDKNILDSQHCIFSATAGGTSGCPFDPTPVVDFRLHSDGHVSAYAGFVIRCNPDEIVDCGGFEVILPEDLAERVRQLLPTWQ